ncbi:hypothetical protein ABNB59_14985 [Paenibacillus larvae]|uniref:Uncharacterized protein n=8 Tax=Paenibacillus larvae TaxID=1464 RepID=V9WA58_9BACL|nr:hypothetical protein [Paenibacillus larvae]AHD06012.1 hypothetical protein ERIC2_c22180 [Paenibacillus larvae subsp. larvae DSM 25430]AQR76486.1 hypothetical protein BXP28_02955 [Paenibacillus larvae subsp. larvae]AQT83684.1 hypothetical protein B1222_03500 [Paenibacillus larvae subsp. pulvifaciens]AQZ48830.1 hypothetical protein B5S25_21850 [Paenibacillus larvae subsp. pulvifaciens]ARF69871.1 hypothetical protein B7C51_21570 [Paenibacillus larvae subsp. pulvifaciens]
MQKKRKKSRGNDKELILLMTAILTLTNYIITLYHYIDPLTTGLPHKGGEMKYKGLLFSLNIISKGIVREQEPTGKIEAEIWFDGRYELALHLDAANKVVDKDTSLSKFPENVDIPLSVLEDIVNLLPLEVKWVKQEL